MQNLTIETNELTKMFGSYTAVDHINVAVLEGEIFGFLGANGAGKTTAIRMICGLLQPTSGSGQVAGFDIMRQSDKIRSRIGYMPQKFSLYTDLSIKQNMLIYGALYNVPHDVLKNQINKLADFLELTNLLSRITGDLPWGWQQRLALACALLHSPKILFLDEPTGSVDPQSRRNFWDLLCNLATMGTTIFITTHHMDEAEYCSRISIMIDGKIAALDTPKGLKKQYESSSLNDVFISLVGGKRTP